MEHERVFVQNLIYEIINFYNIKQIPKSKQEKNWLLQEILDLKKDYEEAERFHDEVFAEEREESEIISALTTCLNEDIYHDIISCPYSHTPEQIKNYYDRVNKTKKIWPSVFSSNTSSSLQCNSKKENEKK